MPIVIIEAEKPLRDRKALGLVVDAVAAAVACPPDSVWVRYEHVPARQYWEGDGTAPYAPAIVTVRLLRGRPRAALKKMMAGIAKALAGGLRMDRKSVWCTVQELDAELTSQGGVPYSALRRVR